MLQLRTLGPVDLVREDGRRVSSVLAQPKRLALLVFLAQAHPRGCRRRDLLLTLFWPEADEHRARNSLSQAIHQLGRSLVEDGVLVRCGADIGLDPRAIRCDAVAFEDALERGEPEQALELHAGPFMEGFHLADAPDFERWVNAERVRLQQRAAAAAGELADRTLSQGRSVEAAALARRALELAPYGETELRRLLNLLHQLGDATGAVLEYERFTARLRDELELEPHPDTRALVERIRAGEGAARRPGAEANDSTDSEPLSTRWSAPAAPNDSSAVSRQPFAAELASPAGTRGAAAGRSSRSGFAASVRRGIARGAAPLAIVALALALVLSGTGADAGVHPGRVLVSTFDNRTGEPALEPLGEMAADWIIRGLQQSGLSEVIDPVSALLAARQASADSGRAAGLERATRSAIASGAQVVVWGAVYRQGDSIYFSTNITEVAHGRLLMTLDPVAAPLAEPMAGAEHLREHVAGALASLLDQRIASPPVAGRRPPTFAAYREFVAGMEKFQSGRGMEAIPHFDAASRLDSTFTLPLIWSIFAYGNEGYRPQRDSVVEILSTRREALGRLDRTVLDYFLAGNRQDPAAQGDAVRRAARLAPGSEWSHNAANHAHAMNRPREALQYLQTVDPEHGWARGWFPFWNNITSGHHLLADHHDELEAARRAISQASDHYLLRALEIRALIALDRVEEAERRLDDLVLLPANRARVIRLRLPIAAEMRAHGHIERAREILRVAEAWLRSPAAEAHIRAQEDPESARFALRLTLGEVLYALGEWDSARTEFERLAAEDPSLGVVTAYLGLLAARRGDATGAERAIQHLAEPGRWAASELDPDLARAQIAALLGDRRRAIEYLRDAVSHNSPRITGRKYMLLHRNADWEALRDYRPFKALVRPKD